MKSNCFYCTKEQPLDDLMVEICKLSASTVYLFKEQTYKGRCNVVYHEHAGNLYDLPEEELHLFMDDVSKVAKAIHSIFSPDKINYGAYGDTMQHLHMHVVPKYEGGETWGGVFVMNPQKVYLSDEEYQDMADKIRQQLA